MSLSLKNIVDLVMKYDIFRSLMVSSTITSGIVEERDSVENLCPIWSDLTLDSAFLL